MDIVKPSSGFVSTRQSGKRDATKFAEWGALLVLSHDMEAKPLLESLAAALTGNSRKPGLTRGGERPKVYETLRKPMHSSCSRCHPATSHPCVVVLATLALLLTIQLVSGAARPQIFGARLADGKLLLNWTGDSFSFEVQRTASLVTSNWVSVLATARTNAVLTVDANAGFFRVVDPDTNLTRLDFVATNLTTGDITYLVKQPQTSSDLVFLDSANSTATFSAQVILPGEELQKFDMAFDGAGGFTFVTAEGDATQFRGHLLRAPGPGAEEVTFTGALSNGVDTLVFSGIAADPTLSVGDAAFSAWWCSGAWAAQALQCQAAAVSRTLGCVGFFPPQPRAGYGYITTRSGVTVTGTNIVGNCTSTCTTCCKDNNTGVLTDCTP